MWPHHLDHFYFSSFLCSDGMIIFAKLLLAFPFAISDKLFCVNATAFQECTTSVPFCSKYVSNALFDESNDSVMHTDTLYHFSDRSYICLKSFVLCFWTFSLPVVFSDFFLSFFFFPITVVVSKEVVLFDWLVDWFLNMVAWCCVYMPWTDEKGAHVSPMSWLPPWSLSLSKQLTHKMRKDRCLETNFKDLEQSMCIINSAVYSFSINQVEILQ